jgi:cytidine deaminase
VVSPCGRRRQILIDYYPIIEAVIKEGNGEEMLMDLARLLSFSYIFKHES